MNFEFITQSNYFVGSKILNREPTGAGYRMEAYPANLFHASLFDRREYQTERRRLSVPKQIRMHYLHELLCLLLYAK